MPPLPFRAAADLVADPAAQALLRRHNVRLVGQGKPPLLFCNGFNCSQSVWHRVAPALAEHYQLIFFDQIGVGGSDRTATTAARYATLQGFVQDVVDICQTLHLQRVVLVGHSAGALVALLAALQQPAQFDKLVLLAFTPRCLNAPDYYGGFEPGDVAAMLHEMTRSYAQWAATFATMLIGQFDAPALSHELVECASQADPVIARRLVELIFLGDYRSELPRLQQPTLLLQCQDDPAVPEEVNRYLLTHLPNASLRVLPSAGHCPHLTVPDAVTAAITQFASCPAPDLVTSIAAGGTY